MFRIFVLIFFLQYFLVSFVNAELPFDLHGFAEVAYGEKFDDGIFDESASLFDIRLQTDFSWELQDISIKLKCDFIHDDILDDNNIDLRDGKGIIDLREANIVLYPYNFIDLKIGRQILTWGTGDLVFINDLFPKDWQSFFIGRDSEYLKAPSDAIKFSMFSDFINIDIVYVPLFNSDRFIKGERISYYNPRLRGITGDNAVIQTVEHDDYFKDTELAIRLYNNFNGVELALYSYEGYFKTPKGMNSLGVGTFPELSVLGMSVRGNILNGIGNLELGYYNSKDDKKGYDPMIQNSEYRFLIGYERELIKNLTISFQYYLEVMLKYKRYKLGLDASMPKSDEDRHVLTTRLTHRSFSDNLILSLFIFYCPSDKDYYLRPKIKYKINDAWDVNMGSNLFGGKYDYTFFGQFKDNNNIYFRVRYSY